MVKLSPINRLRPFWAGCLALLFFAVCAQGAPLRVVTWNLQPNSLAGTNGQLSKFQKDLVLEAADALKKIKPDVILLQQVPNWETCRQLATALKPAVYNVSLCSSFRDSDAKHLSGRQVAILSKSKAYFSWSEAWTGDKTSTASGGFAFAAIRVDDKNVGLISVQIDNDLALDISETDLVKHQQMREASARQLAQQITALQGWKTNQLQAFVVAGDFNTTLDDPRFAQEKTLLELKQLGFENALGTLRADKRVTLPANDQRPAATVDYIFALGSSVARPRVIQTALPDHAAVTCELDLETPPVAVAVAEPVAHTEVSPTTIAAKPANQTSILASAKPNPQANSHLFVWAIGILAGAAMLIWFWRTSNRPQPKPDVGVVALRPDELDFDNQSLSSLPPMSDATRDGVTANLSRWLKEKFVRKLISDRAQMMNAQRLAALKILAVDERLAKIEKQIRERNSEYEERIAELVAELETAREENRELIQAKIDLVKAEMVKQGLKPGRLSKSNQQN